jgi:hypothetical protein
VVEQKEGPKHTQQALMCMLGALTILARINRILWVVPLAKRLVHPTLHASSRCWNSPFKRPQAMLAPLHPCPDRTELVAEPLATAICYGKLGQRSWKAH